MSQLLLSSIEFCFTKQANLLEMEYDMKIAQCLVAMHNYVRLALLNFEEMSDNLVGLKMFNKAFCTQLPTSLKELSNFQFQEEEEEIKNPVRQSVSQTKKMVKYPWMPDFNEDYLYSKINEDMNEESEFMYTRGRNLIEQGL